MKIKLWLPFKVWLVLLCVGCAAKTSPPLRTVPEGPPNVSTPTEETPLVNEGSLWQDSAGYLFTDPKARSVGDIVTVNIVEKASASGNASTKAGKKSSLSADISSLLGLEKSVASRNSHIDPTNLLSASADNSFNGSGQISRSGKINASISARVIRVLPNGNLIIRGTRQVTINNEQQIITIQGIIRPEDITPDNTIASTYIADAQIAYTGKGVVSDKQRPGWLSRVIDRLWPF